MRCQKVNYIIMYLVKINIILRGFLTFALVFHFLDGDNIFGTLNADAPFLVGNTNGLWFVDKSGSNVFGKRFQNAQQFFEGFAAVRENKRWRFINEAGSYLSTNDYSYAESFRGGYALVGNNGLYGAIDRSGVVTLELNHRLLNGFLGGFFAFGENRRFGVIDGRGKILLKPTLRSIDSIRGGYCVARGGDRNLCGAFSLDGTQILPFEYFILSGFSEGLFIAGKGDGFLTYLKPNGEKAFEETFVSAREFIGGFALVLERTGRWSVIGRDGKVVAVTRFNYVGPQTLGCFRVKIGERWGVSTADGKVLVPVIYDSVAFGEEDGRVLVTHGSRGGYVSTNGSVLVRLRVWD